MQHKKCFTCIEVASNDSTSVHKETANIIGEECAPCDVEPGASSCIQARTAGITLSSLAVVSPVRCHQQVLLRVAHIEEQGANE